VAAGLARRCEVQLAYAIGVVEPVSIMVSTFGTGAVSDETIVEAVRAVFDLTPRGIIEALDLRKPIYSPTAAYGHFGRPSADVTHTVYADGKPKSQTNVGFTWERTDKADALRAHAAR